MIGLLRTQIVSVICFFLLASTVYAEVCQVEDPNIENDVLKVRPFLGPNDKPREYIQWSILDLALEKSQMPYDLEVSSHSANARWAQQLEQLGTEANLRFLSFNPKRESEAFPIRIPIFRGLLSYSYIWVREDNVDRFSYVKTLDDLKNLSILSPDQWPNTKLFRDAGLNILSAEFENLPNMLMRGRADAFIYPAMESANFLAQSNAEFELVPLPHVMIRYPLDHYFYVDDCSKDLQDALTKGLLAAFADGSYERLLLTHPVTGEAFKRIEDGDFNIIDIYGQQMTEETRIAMEKYGVKIE